MFDPNNLLMYLHTDVFHCFQVLHVSVFVQSDASLAATVKVPSLQDAQYAISQLHRRKIGHKRIIISYAHSGSPHNPQYIRYFNLKAYIFGYS